MNPLDELLRENSAEPAKLAGSTPMILYGIVNAVSPLTITLDGDTTPMEIEPSSTVTGILVNDVVMCSLQDGELIVTGVIDGYDWVGELTEGLVSGEKEVALTALTADRIVLGGDDVTTLIRNAPRGIIAHSTPDSDSANVTTTELIHAELRAVLQPERTYRVKVAPHLMDADNGDTTAELRLRAEYDGGAVTTSSTLIQSGRWTPPTNVSTSFPGVEKMISTAGQSADLREVRFSYSLIRVAGTGNVWIQSSATAPMVLSIEDIGPAIAVASTVVTYTSTWNATALWDEGINNIMGTGWNFVGNNGYPVWAQAVFGGNATSGETGRTIASAMSGSTLIKAEVALSLKPWVGSSVDTNILGNTLTAVSTTTPTGSAFSASKSTTAKWRQWHNITSIFTASMRGLWIGDPGAGYADTQALLMATTTGADALQLRLTYKR